MEANACCAALISRRRFHVVYRRALPMRAIDCRCDVSRCHDALFIVSQVL
jgi:hypothetical protein